MRPWLAVFIVTLGLSIDNHAENKVLNPEKQETGNEINIQIETGDSEKIPQSNQTGRQEKSIQMIVGGQSEDGVAKKKTMPVKK